MHTVDEFAVENSHANHAANELKILKMVGVDARVGVNLQRVNVTA